MLLKNLGNSNIHHFGPTGQIKRLLIIEPTNRLQPLLGNPARQPPPPLLCLINHIINANPTSQRL
jgi:hypothetical protein